MIKNIFVYFLLTYPLFSNAKLPYNKAFDTFVSDAVVKENVSLVENIEKDQWDKLIQELRNDPELVRQMINRAIDSKQYDLLSKLIRIYKVVPDADKILLNYAEAIISSQNGEYKKAIKIYRYIIAENPNFQPVRFRLAQVLFDDRQNEASLIQFRKLQSERLPPDIALIVEQYIAALQKRDDWKLNFGLTYLKEDNINNASQKDNIYVGNMSFKKSQSSLPQKANGISYVFNFSKDLNLVGYYYFHFGNELNGKLFWDNHSFDELNNRISLGYFYQNARNRIGLLPFYEMRWYNNHRHNKVYGLRVESDHWIDSKWQFSTRLESGKVKYRSFNKILDGSNQLGAATLVYAFNSESYVYSGLEIFNDQVTEKSLASIRTTAKLGWGQEWYKGLSSKIQVSYGKRNFAKKHQIFNEVRQDKEFNLNIMLWKRDFHFGGMTPKLTYSYRKVKSNFADLYSYKKDSIYVSFEKTF